jgi:Domain of unknown function (DUF4129)
MRGNAARILLPALVVLALVGVVAIASTGSTSTGTSRVRSPSDTLLDTILSLGLVAPLLGAALLIYGLTQRKAIQEQLASGRHPRTRILGFLLFACLVGLVSYFRLAKRELLPNDNELDPVFPPGQRPVPGAPDPGAAAAYEPEFAWLPIGVIVGLAAAGFIAYAVAQRRATRAARDEDELAEQLVVVLDETLDDLRAESDPRRAVIAAYARLERVLAAHGAARRRAETPDEYLARVLGELAVDAGAVRRLTDLFSWAKFSQHAVDLAMKGEAIDALEHVRDGLRSAAAAAEEPQEGALTTTGAIP